MSQIHPICARIKAFRTERGWSQQQLAEEADISPDTLSLIERGENSPRLVTLEKLSNAFDVPLTTLVDYAPNASNERSSLEAQLAAASHDLSEDMLAVAVDQIRALAARRD